LIVSDTASRSRDAQPLQGIRVVAVEQAVAAPLCSRHLADLGADVVKVERPDGGDFARGYDSIVHGESAYFVWLNHGKRSVTLDLGSTSGRRALEALLGTADVFVHNLGPGAIERLGFGEGEIRSRWPRLVSCAISGFGATGPFRDHKAFDLLLQAESGLVSVTGSPEGPARVGISVADISAGMYALAAILAALVERDRTGEGTQLHVAMLDGLAEWMAVPGLYERYTGVPPARLGLHHPSIAPYGPYGTRDGTVLIAIQNEAQWRRFCHQVLERPELGTDERFSSNELRVAARDALDRAIGDCFARLDRTEVVERLEAGDIPFASLNSVKDLLDHPQLAARARWIDIETPTGPAIAPRSPLGDGNRIVPGPGDDTAAILGDIGLDR
jgi:crotonobetainyl-CoA:carnitine CoA-transferase CaiB-like acyl-CoA transferase